MLRQDLLRVGQESICLFLTAKRKYPLCSAVLPDKDDVLVNDDTGNWSPCLKFGIMRVVGDIQCDDDEDGGECFGKDNWI